MPSNTSRTHLTRSMIRAFQQIPPSVLNAIIPGYSVFESIAKIIGVNISILAFGFVLVAGAQFGFENVIVPFWTTLTRLICSKVVIGEEDSMYDTLLDWFQKQTSTQRLRTAELTSGDMPSEDDFHDDHQTDMIFNYREWINKTPFRYLPKSSGIFFHGGHFFRIDRVEILHDGFRRPSMKLETFVFWPSIEPVKSLMEEIRDEDLSTYLDSTYIYRPLLEIKSSPLWRYIASGRSRPISTVEFDRDSKETIVKDMNDFFNPLSKPWYRKLGRRHHRGYLFHGPPGCGKTSLAFSLGGLFGVNIYCLSLNDSHLTEEGLMILMAKLPRRCIVLLEDIDSAGVIESESQSGSPKQSISFSCLLNSMDGVASPEGCAFILTTNYPKKLPPELIRSGRVDLTIEFGLATKQQIRDLFVRLYSSETENPSPRPKKLSDIFPPTDPPVDLELRSLADRFAQEIPDKTYSLASIQDLLMRHKDDPDKAVSDIHDWLEKNSPTTDDSHEQQEEHVPETNDSVTNHWTPYLRWVKLPVRR